MWQVQQTHGHCTYELVGILQREVLISYDTATEKEKRSFPNLVVPSWGNVQYLKSKPRS